MTTDQFDALYEQHAQIIVEIRDVYIALVIGAFIGLLLLLTMLAAAAWSVRKVITRQTSLEGKFALLIDVLLRQAERDIEREKEH